MFHDKIIIMDTNKVNRYIKITPELKAEIIAGLIAGVGVCELNRRYDISKASISKIKQELESDNQTLVDANVKDRIDDLLIDSLKLHLNALGNIARTTFDEDFIKAQRASDLAALHSQLRDWSLLLLEAANPNS
jgi:transposase-like protein